MKKIAHISTTYLELSETFVYAFMQSLKRYEPFVICEELKNEDKFPLTTIHRIKSFNLPERLINRVSRELLTRNLTSEHYYAKIINKENPDILHAHYGPRGVYALPLKENFSLPLVTSFYGFDLSLRAVGNILKGTFRKQGYWEKAYQKLFKNGDLFLTYYRKGKKILVSWGCPHEKIIVHPTGIDLSEFEYRPHELGPQVKLLMVNRMVEKKGIEFALRALHLLKDEYPGICLRLIGDGPLKEKINNLVHELNLQDHIEMPGFLPHDIVKKEFENADIFLSPSVVGSDGDDEGGGNVTVLEAMASGIPVIASIESGGEFVFNGKNGLICKEWDVEDLAEKIKYLLEDPYVWSVLTQQARQLVENEYNMEKQVIKLEEIYDDLLAANIR